MSIWPTISAPGRRIGYARVSTKDQKLRMQRDGLQAVGCERVFEDHGVSGTRSSRPGLDAMLDIETVLAAHRAIAQDGISITETAHRLGVSRSTLSRGLQRLQDA